MTIEQIEYTLKPYRAPYMPVAEVEMAFSEMCKLLEEREFYKQAFDEAIENQKHMFTESEIREAISVLESQNQADAGLPYALMQELKKMKLNGQSADAEVEK